MQTPSARYFCPRCRSAFDADTPYCGQCGADMRRASCLDLAAERGEASGRARRVTEGAPSPSSDRRGGGDPWLGRLIDGRYKVEEVLGRGGMGVVYKIKHQRMGKIAAMKVLHNELAKDPEVVARFQREAEVVSRLAHPNTVQVFDFGAVDGALYLVMEYVRGQDLGAIIDRDGPMRFAEVAPLLGQICGSLMEAHDMGVVHRDLKPENILVSRTHGGHDFVKVLDFGLAKLSERDEVSSVTSTGSIVGTPYYMSPEQIRAEVEVDNRADIYSMGALVYRLVTADNAFNAQTPVGVLTKHLTEKLEPPSVRYPELGLPRGLDDIVVRCMAKLPDDRYQSVRELVSDIEKLYSATVSDTSDVIRGGPNWLAEAASNGTGPAAALLEDEIDHGIDADLRLRREDLDDFENSMRRKRSLRVVGIPLLLALAAGAGAYYIVMRPETVRTTELEPNNELSEATLIAANTPIAGYIGKRISKLEPDRDFYRFAPRNAQEEPAIVTVRVTTASNLDIAIDLYEQSGKLMKHSDERGIGGDEILRSWRTSGPIAVRVSGVFEGKEGELPTENVSDPYTLTVVFAPVDPRLESEPNDSRADANELQIGTPVTGYLDHKGDVDVFRVAVAGTYKFLVSGGPDVPFEWRINEETTWRSDLKATIALESDSVISIRRKPGSKLTSLDAPYTIDLSASR